jgi:hypothetical protein
MGLYFHFVARLEEYVGQAKARAVQGVATGVVWVGAEYITVRRIESKLLGGNISFECSRSSVSLVT